MPRTIIAAALLAALIGTAGAHGAWAASGDVERSTYDNDKAYKGVRQQQGRVLTDSDSNPSAAKHGDITLKRGVISRDAAIKQRQALEPLKKRMNTRGMRTAEAEYVEKLREWAVRQDRRLLELQKVHSAHDRLKGYRDRAVAKGEDVSRIEPRLKGMERKIAALSEDAQLARVKLQELMSRYQVKIKYMSHMTKSQHDTAMAVIRKIGG
ncbi:MAG: hypothetical protein ACLFWF_11070 [Alphaproteobacteria bacterium]